MMNYRYAALAAVALTGPLAAQEAALAPTQAVPAMSDALSLPANTDVSLALNSGLSSKSHNVGDKVSMTVARDVLAGSSVVIPRGTHAVGQVTRVIHNGSFGKSGKMELAFRYIDFNGRQVPVEGTYFQEGEGNTAGTVGAVLAAGVIGGLVVKGHSATIPEGREFSAHTTDAVPFVGSSVSGAPWALASGYNPAPVNMQVETEKERKKRLKREAKEAKHRS
jgi:hypothetical protein